MILKLQRSASITGYFLYAIFSLVEILVYPLIYFIPMWGICKCGIMFWLYCPVTQGGLKIMARLSPVFKNSVEYRFDALIDSIPGVAMLMSKKEREEKKRTE